MPTPEQHALVTNLEWATDSENKRHRYGVLRAPRGKSGVYGVNWRPDKGKWRAYTTIGGYKSLGVFHNKDDAVRMATQARKEFYE